MYRFHLSLFLIFFIIASSISFAQEVSWAVTAGGSNDHDRGMSVAVDDLGNVYSTGKISNDGKFGTGANQVTVATEGYIDFYVAKYDSSGNLLWVFTEAGIGSNIGTAIEVDAAGNIFVLGKFEKTITFDEGTSSPVTLTSTSHNAGDDDVFVAKYNNSKELQWVKQIEGPYDEYIIGGFEVDNEGSILLAGSFQDSIIVESTILTSNGENDMFLIKLDSTGQLLWALSEGGIGWDGVASCSIDSDNNIIIGGSFRESFEYGNGSNKTNVISRGFYDAFVAKYDKDGTFLWVETGGGGGADLTKSVSFDKNGNVYSSGYFVKNATFGTGSPNETVLTNVATIGENIFLTKYTPAGELEWVKQSKCNENISTRGLSIAMDQEENILVSGYISGYLAGTPVTFEGQEVPQFGKSDIFIARYNTNGELMNIVSAGGPKNELAYSMACDINNNVYITGWYGSGSSASSDITFGEGTNSITLTSAGWDNIFIAKYKPFIEMKKYSVTFNVANGLEPEVTLGSYGTKTAVGGLISFDSIIETSSSGIQYTIILNEYFTITDNIIVDENETIDITMIVDSTISILESAFNDMEIFAFNNMLNITLADNSSKDANLIINDISGRIVEEIIIPQAKGKQQYQFDLSKHTRGIYFITINTGEKSFAPTKKIIIN